MAQTKYVIFKNEDARKYLTPQQKQWLLEILRTVAEGRRQENKSVGDLFFVLNMKDQYAVDAIDAYIAAIQNDGLYANNLSVQAALDTAIKVKQVAAFNVTSRLPD